MLASARSAVGTTLRPEFDWEAHVAAKRIVQDMSQCHTDSIMMTMVNVNMVGRGAESLCREEELADEMSGTRL